MLLRSMYFSLRCRCFEAQGEMQAISSCLFRRHVFISERGGKETAMAMEYEPREAVKWWQFVTSTKMLHTKRLQRMWGGYVSI